MHHDVVALLLVPSQVTALAASQFPAPARAQSRFNVALPLGLAVAVPPDVVDLFVIGRIS